MLLVFNSVFMAIDEQQQQHSVHEPLLSSEVFVDPAYLENTSKKKRALTRFLLTSAKWVLKIIMWVIFIAWVVFLYVVPSYSGSNLYDDLIDDTSGTLFGETGVVFLIYGGPILIIAILAFPYLVITSLEGEEKLQEKKDPKCPRFRLGTFPVLVDGPFGVVTAAELIGIILFIVFVIWAVYSYTLVNFILLPSYGPETPAEQRIIMVRMTGYMLGLTALTCLAFLFLPIARGSLLLRLINIPFEYATRYHIWLGNLTMFLLTLHALFYFTEFIMRGSVLSEILEWKSDRGANFAGVICYSFALVMWLTSLPPVRKRYFELFLYAHHLYILFFIFMALHIGDTYFCKAAAGIFLFMLDRFLRFCQSRRTVNVTSVACFPCGTVQLVLSKPRNLQYNALSFIFLRVRELAPLQWHPFSVSSSPLDGKSHLSVLIKSVGDWTGKLRGTILSMSGEEPQTEIPFQPHSRITASVEGPYGHESPYYLMYENIIFVAGGSGISPFVAILGDILHRLKESKPCLTRNILLVWAMKKSNELPLLYTVGVESISPDLSDKLNLDIRTYVTQESVPLLEEGKVDSGMISSVVPDFNGFRMSVLVGTGNIIWSGIYVTVSIVGLVITLGVLDIIYINPLSISKWWYKGILFLGCMVASVLIFGGPVIGLWHLWERNSARNESDVDWKRIDMVQHRGPVAHKYSCREYLASSNTIHYGCRPNFEEIFRSTAEHWGHIDVGVIVCGPPTLQSSVAKECRSQNLRKGNYPIFHFNSHSFAL